MIVVYTSNVPGLAAVCFTASGHAGDDNDLDAVRACAAVSQTMVLGHTLFRTPSDPLPAPGEATFTVPQSYFQSAELMLSGLFLLSQMYPEYVRVIRGDTWLYQGENASWQSPKLL